jgi:hypothetical protein
MRFVLTALFFLSISLAQTAPEGYVSKETIVKFFKRTQGGDITFSALSPLFVEQGIELPPGLGVIASIQQDFGGMGGPSQSNARAYSEVPEDMSLEGFRQQFLDDGWTDLTTSGLTVWGFVNADNSITTFDNNYGNFCKDNVSIYYNNYEGMLELSLDVYDNDTDMCETQNQGMMLMSPAIAVPDLKLSAPTGSLTLVAEPLVGPIEKSTLRNIDLPGGWSSRATLSTTLTASRVLADYNQQMREAGWTMGRNNADEINTWSEWTFTDEAGQKWLATVNVTHHEAFKNLVMPILVVFTVE